MRDLEVAIGISVAEECDKRRAAENDATSDPALHAPFGIVRLDLLPTKSEQPN